MKCRFSISHETFPLFLFFAIFARECKRTAIISFFCWRASKHLRASLPLLEFIREAMIKLMQPFLISWESAKIYLNHPSSGHQSMIGFQWSLNQWFIFIFVWNFEWWLGSHSPQFDHSTLHTFFSSDAPEGSLGFSSRELFPPFQK